MKNNRLVKYLILFSVVQMIFLTFVIMSNAVTIDKLRVGLIFKESKYGVDKSATNFTLNSNNGLQIGIQNTDFENVFTEPSSSSVSVVKSVYFKNNNVGFTSNNYLTTTSSSYYFVKLEETFSSAQLADIRLNELATKSINAYKMYNGTWQIFMGTYITSTNAQYDIDNQYKIFYPQGSFSIVQPSSTRFFVFNQNNLIMVDGTFNKIRIKQFNNSNTVPIIKINNDSKRAYRGEMEVYYVSTSGITLVNELPMEEYLYGVVPCELESSAPLEALKAQAVAARTYAVITMSKYSHLGFNLCNTTVCQVYGGYSKEASSTNLAVDQTKAKLVTYEGKPAATYFFASSGGMTEDAENVWGNSVPYLKAVEDKYEAGNSWNYNWQSTFSAIGLKQTMIKRGYDLGDILSLAITQKTNAGRALEVILTGTKTNRTYKRDDTRNFLNLPSQLYNISSDADIVIKVNDTETKKTSLGNMKIMTATGIKTVSATDKAYTLIDDKNTKIFISPVATSYKIVGKGWGHGLGMSQEGAKGMAKQGFNYEQILEHYYQGTKVE